MTCDEVKNLIEAGVTGATATVNDLTGTGDHFQAKVIAPLFSGKTMIEQHQLVYKALGSFMGGAIHALQLSTSAQ